MSRYRREFGDPLAGWVRGGCGLLSGSWKLSKDSCVAVRVVPVLTTSWLASARERAVGRGTGLVLRPGTSLIPGSRSGRITELRWPGGVHPCLADGEWLAVTHRTAATASRVIGCCLCASPDAAAFPVAGEVLLRGSRLRAALGGPVPADATGMCGVPDCLPDGFTSSPVLLMSPAGLV